MNDPVFQLRYLVMPDFIYTDTRLTLISVKIFCFIHSYKNPFYFSNSHLSEMFKCSERGIEEGIKLLKELGYIKTESKPKAKGGKTRITLECGSEPQSSVVPYIHIKDNNLKNIDNPIVNTVEEVQNKLDSSDLTEEYKVNKSKHLSSKGFRFGLSGARAGKEREFKKRGGVARYGQD